MAIQLGQEYKTAEATQGGTFKKPSPGGYILKCVKAEEGVTKEKGEPKVTFSFDIAKGEFAGAFEKYPIQYIQTFGEKALPFFKWIIKSLTESNQGKQFIDPQGVFHTERVVGCLIAGNLREEEYINKENNLKTSFKIGSFESIQNVSDLKPMVTKKTTAQSENHPYSPGGHGNPDDNDLSGWG